MAVKPGDIYRGHRHARTAVAIIVTVLVLLLVVAVVLFYSLQKFVVVGQDGVELKLPFLAEETAEISGTENIETNEVQAEIVIKDANFDDLDSTAGTGLSELRALYVPSDEANADGIASKLGALEGSGANALVINMKPDSGQLAWVSSVEYAVSYGTTGEADLTEAIAAAKASGVYLVAQISCCVDNLMALRNAPLALTNSSGEKYQDSDDSYWLDPHSRDLRNYIIDLIQELAEMGFDEVLLTNLMHPNAEGLVSSVESSAEVSISSAISSFALGVTKNFDEADVKVSLLLDSASLSEGLTSTTGQDVEQLASFFDRFYLATSSDTLEANKALACVGMEDTSLRFVPITSSAPPSTCWVVQ